MKQIKVNYMSGTRHLLDNDFSVLSDASQGNPSIDINSMKNK